MLKSDGDSHSIQCGPSPEAFECWRLVIPPGSVRETSAAEWAGALVMVESGVIEVGCLGGSHRTFVAGDLLALAWLALETVGNPGPEEACVVAVRRRVRG